MATRNFWITARIDGRETLLEGGPRNKEGGLSITLYQRDKGGIETAFEINCWEEGGKLYSWVTQKHNQSNDGNKLVCITDR